MQLQKLTLPNDLSLLPTPFYDSKDMQSLTLPFVFRFQGVAGDAAGRGNRCVVVRWPGLVQGGELPDQLRHDPQRQRGGVRDRRRRSRPGSTLPAITGPTISVDSQPEQSRSQAAAGAWAATPRNCSAAAATLSLGSTTLTGQTQVVGTPNIPARKAYDAPRWVPIDRPVRFGELVQPTDLQGNGLVPGLLTLNFRTAPDMFVWGNTGVPLKIRYRYPAGTLDQFP